MNSVAIEFATDGFAAVVSSWALRRAFQDDTARDRGAR